MQAFFEKIFGFFEIFFYPRKYPNFSIVTSVFFSLWNSFHFLVFCRFLWYNKCAAALRAFLGADTPRPVCLPRAALRFLPLTF